MKKIIISLFIMMCGASLFSQNYFSIQVNEKVHFQDVELDSCIIVINSASMRELTELKVAIFIQTYKSKSISESNPNWVIYTNEIQSSMILPVGRIFTEGDLILKVSEAIKEYLLIVNPTWQANNIIILK